MYGYWFGMSLVWWIFWAVVIVAFFAFLTPVPRRSARPSSDPLEILKRRYAAGEITTAEFDERMARLVGRPTGAAEAPRSTLPVPPRTSAPAEEGTRH